jgi:hypothetical protein
VARQHTRVELYYDGAWNDHTNRVYTRTPIEISRGRGDEQGEPTPGSASLSLSNLNVSRQIDHRYNPRDARSDLYGKIGRNTPIRISNGPAAALEDDFNRSVSNAWTGGSFTWTNSGGTVPDDYDINGTHGVHTHPSANVLHHSTADTGSVNHRVRAVVKLSAGTVTGANASTWVLGRFADVSNYYAALVSMTTTGTVTIGVFKRVAGSLTTLVAPAVTHAGYGGLFATYQFGVELLIEGSTLRAKIWDASNDEESTAWSITATDTDLTAGTSAGVADRRETGNTNANLEFQYDSFLAVGGTIRFTGEVASWKPRRAIKGDAWTEVTAKGVLHRLSQGATPLRSAAFREVNRQTGLGVIAYWPAEDEQGARSLAAGIPGVAPMRIVGGTPTLGSARQFPGSAPVVDMGSAPTPVFHARCPESTATGTIKFRMFASFPAAGIGTDQILADVYVRPGTGTVRLWRYTYHTGSGGFYSLRGYDSTFALVEDSGGSVPGDGLDGDTWMLGFEVTQNGADVDYETAAHRLNADGTQTGFAGPSTFTGQTVGTPDEVYIGPNAGLADVAVGHIIVGSSSVTVDGLEQAFTGWIKETVAARLTRLCAENDVAFTLIGTAADTMPAGPQPVDTLVSQFAECERSDGGFLFETRIEQGVTYRTRTDLYSQTPALTLDFDGGQIAPPVEPDIDDQNVRNDITVSNRDGTSARAVQETGPLNIQAPGDDPDGVGRYESQYDVNVNGEERLSQIATWRLHLGTEEATRYPVATVDLNAAPALVTTVDQFDIGDVAAIDNLEADQVVQLAPGYGETIGSHRRLWTANCVPAAPYNVAVLDDPVLGRLDTEDSELASGITTTATSLSVTTNSGPLWTTSAGQMPFDIRIGGEVITVTAIAGASSPQTFTVTRSTNGVVKAHDAGAPVNVANPVVIAL